MTTCTQYLSVTAGVFLLTLASARAGQSEVKGTFNGDGKPAKLAFASAYAGGPRADKGTIVLVFTEKDPSKEEKPEMASASCDLGSALVVTVNAAGEIVTCDVAHEAHTKKPFTSIGTLKLSDFKNEGGNIQGKLSTNGKADFMGQTWEADLTFKTPAP
jgi:hypothetical protein